MNDDAPLNIEEISLADETSSLIRYHRILQLRGNTEDISSTEETFHPDRPSMIEESRNMCAMLRTSDRSGTSSAACVMLDAPLNASDMDVHRVVPHESMELSMAALVASAPSLILSKPCVDTV